MAWVTFSLWGRKKILSCCELKLLISACKLLSILNVSFFGDARLGAPKCKNLLLSVLSWEALLCRSG